MTIHLLSGFLGSGKTTAIQQACKYLMGKGNSVGVIANDQGRRLVDGDFFTHHNIPNRQVLNGCFCCNYSDFEERIASLTEANRPDFIFAESVGSCTDIVSTVIKPLLKYTKNSAVTLSTFADVRLLDILLTEKKSVFHESVRYIYFKQLEEAAIIIITKVDLVDQQLLHEVKRMMEERYCGKVFLYQDSMNPADIQTWLDFLDSHLATQKLSSIQIAYDTYGEGEAKLAWFDQEMDIYSSDNAPKDALRLIRVIHDKMDELKYPVGHLKFLLDGQTKISFTRISEEHSLDDLTLEKKLHARLLINARVQTTPELLSGALMKVIREIQPELNCVIMIRDTASFQPGFPKPTHRILE